MPSRLDTQLLHNRDVFAPAYAPADLGPPTLGVVIVTCVDHRIDLAAALGLGVGSVAYLRNAGGRIDQAAIRDLLILARLAAVFSPEGQPLQPEIAVIHHTQCGTGFLGDPEFLRETAQWTGLDAATLGKTVVIDPFTTVREDVDALRSSTLRGKASVSGWVLDLGTGLVEKVTDAR